MITPIPLGLETKAWQREYADAITEPAELLALLELAPGQVPDLATTDTGFPLRVTRYFAGLMRRGDPSDPLLRQMLPCRSEFTDVPGFVADPVGDNAASPVAGVLQKYRGRALLMTTGACAVHCRYCFRRHFPYAAHSLSRHLDAALSQLERTPELHEVILSGGDPLSLGDERLLPLLRRITALPTLRRLRIHTRLPVVLPSRMTKTLIDALGDLPATTVFVLHINHPNEVTPSLHGALEPLRRGGAQLLNQSVLLKSINDDADILAELSESLMDIGVLPYYMHLLDPVAGAAHFEVDKEAAGQLHRQLQARLPGYLVPRFVREVAGHSAKTPMADL